MGRIACWSLAGVVAVSFMSAQAYAGAKAPPGYENGKDRHYGYSYSKVPLVESHRSALDRSWSGMEKHLDGDYDKLKAAAAEFETTARKADEERRKWEGEIGVQRKALAAEQAKYDDLGKRVQRALAEEPGAESMESLKKQMDDSMGRLVGGKQKLKELENGFQAARAASAEVLSRAEEGLSQFDSSIAKYDKDLRISKDASPEELRQALARLDENVLKRMKLDHSRQIIDEMYDRTKDDLIETKMLFGDFKQLENDLKLTGHRMQAFMEATGRRLDRTLMGKYIEEKIRDQFCKLQAQKPVCAIEAISDAAAGKPGQPLGQGLRAPGSGAPGGADEAK
ncbi:MAG: hypothetical protein NDJ89_15615 [Oligoflexia bacterium]|nr:hypothetical protein [Oligoflexia bacterium]